MDRRIISYISELLYNNDCVIVSGFGGFVARHVPASLFSSGSLLTPPAKSVLFNRNLKSNDGLLANYIMEKQLLSYPEANRVIDQFAAACQLHLEENHRLELENIGVLYLDAEKNIQFEPQADVNYLIESFGLSPLFAQPIISAEPVKQPEKTDRVIVPEPQQPVLPIRRTNYRRIAAVAVGVPLLLTALLFSLQTAPLKNTVFASLNPFGNKTEAVYQPVEYKKKNNEYTTEKTAALHPDANGYASFRVSENSGYVIVNVCDTVNTDKTFVKKYIAPVKTSTGFAGKYQVVLGCFSVEDNAQRLVNTLHSRNIHAAISGTNKKGLHVVSAGGFKDLDSARAMLQQVRQNFPSAWLMTE